MLNKKESQNQKRAQKYYNALVDAITIGDVENANILCMQNSKVYINTCQVNNSLVRLIDTSDLTLNLHETKDDIKQKFLLIKDVNELAHHEVKSVLNIVKKNQHMSWIRDVLVGRKLGIGDEVTLKGMRSAHQLILERLSQMSEEAFREKIAQLQLENTKLLQAKERYNALVDKTTVSDLVNMDILLMKKGRLYINTYINYTDKNDALRLIDFSNQRLELYFKEDDIQKNFSRKDINKLEENEKTSVLNIVKKNQHMSWIRDKLVATKLGIRDKLTSKDMRSAHQFILEHLFGMSKEEFVEIQRRPLKNSLKELAQIYNGLASTSQLKAAKVQFKEVLIEMLEKQGLTREEAKPYAEELLNQESIVGFKRHKGIMGLKIALGTAGVTGLITSIIGFLALQNVIIIPAAMSNLIVLALTNPMSTGIVLGALVIISLLAITCAIMKHSKQATFAGKLIEEKEKKEKAAAPAAQGEEPKADNFRLQLEAKLESVVNSVTEAFQSLSVDKGNNVISYSQYSGIKQTNKKNFARLVKAKIQKNLQSRSI